jgi:drug/metabolite transporter (DMT)-like permease
MALKAAAYAALSGGCFPIAGMVASPDLKPLLAAFGLSFSAASLLAIAIYRKSLHPDQATPALKTRLAAGMVAVVCLAIGQIVMIAVTVINRMG